MGYIGFFILLNHSVSPLHPVDVSRVILGKMFVLPYRLDASSYDNGDLSE